MDMPKLPQGAGKIIEKLEKNGFEAYIVGGCVRDFIMNISAHDWDITTSALPQEVKRLFSHTFDSGIKHGTITVLECGESYEVTTYRIDGKYADCRHPDEVTFTRDIHEDLLRRDFTMNAIAYSPRDGFVDIFGGIADIKNKTIKGAGDPDERFREDALRMLRAVRFSAQLGFDIEYETKKALEANVSLISKISSERIREELCKLLTSHYCEKIPLLWQSGLLYGFSPEIAKSISGHEAEIISAIKNSDKTVSIVFAVLVRFVPEKELKKVLAFFKFDNKTLDEITLICQNKNLFVRSDFVSVRKTCSRLGIDGASLLYRFLYACQNSEAKNALDTLEAIINQKQCVSIKELCINGKDLIAIGIPPGKKMGTVLEKLLNMVLENPALNSRETLLKTAETEKNTIPPL